MTALTRFDKVTCNALRDELVQALQETAKKYGVEITPGGGTFSDMEWSARFQVKILDKAAVLQSARVEFEQYARLYGFERSDLGREFDSQGHTWKIVGLAIGRSKYNLKAERVTDGKVMLFVSEQIAKKLHYKAVAA